MTQRDHARAADPRAGVSTRRPARVQALRSPSPCRGRSSSRSRLDAGHEGQTYELTGDEAWTLADLAAEISRQSGRTIPYQDLPVEEYAAVLLSVGLPEALAQAIAGWDVAAAQGALFDDSHQLSRLIGRPTTPLSVAVAEALRAAHALPQGA